MKRFFGTDGIRGVAGEPPLDERSVRRFGAALADVVGAEIGRPCRIVVGRDTRESGPWLRDAVVSGLSARGAAAVDAGVITTPGVAHALREGGFDGAVMISASHNPFRDNGLKAFGATGLKLSDAGEKRVEARMLEASLPDVTDPGPPAPLDGSHTRRYVEFLEGVLGAPECFNDLSLALDCANGSASDIAPEVFRHHGATVHAIGTSPDGCNINLGCGSLHLEKLRETMLREGCDLGLAFDGDADRCLAVDRKGRTVDGDHILYIVGGWMHRQGRLRGDALVATIMSNLWLEKRLSEEGVELRRTAVGDKYVLERMLEDDLSLGGEQSGHVICREHATTGDGVLTGMLLLAALNDGGAPLEEILDGIERYPQVQLSITVGSKPELDSHQRIGPAVAGIERELAGSGRVVLRYSGTEPVARVMVEGTDADAVRRHAESLAQLIEEELSG